jgi:hypothetical protein
LRGNSFPPFTKMWSVEPEVPFHVNLSREGTLRM